MWEIHSAVLAHNLLLSFRLVSVRSLKSAEPLLESGRHHRGDKPDAPKRPLGFDFDFLFSFSKKELLPDSISGTSDEAVPFL